MYMTKNATPDNTSTARFGRVETEQKSRDKNVCTGLVLGAASGGEGGERAFGYRSVELLVNQLPPRLNPQ